MIETTIAPPRVVARQPLRTSYRIESIDLLRGLVMIIMALDHTRDFFHVTAMSDDPLNLQTTTPLLFFTRWITHFCAPVFVFLAGMSIFFQSQRKSKADLTKFLVTRGLWLIVIDVIIMSFAFTFDPGFKVVAVQTIWSIGISMAIMGLLTWLPFAAIAGIGAVIVLGSNLLDFYEKANPGQHSLVYSLLHQQGFFPIGGNHLLLVFYPFLPWLGVMIMGYCLGKFFTRWEGKQRRNRLYLIGSAIIVFFIGLRMANVYGDNIPWSPQKTPLFTFLSFIKTQKYPPSLLYTCMTIGPALIFLAAFGNVKNRLTKIITVYGRVPFLYYVLHFFVLHAAAMILFYAQGHKTAEGIAKTGIIPNFVIPGHGLSLGYVYLIWIAVVVALYPVCKWFSDYKQHHKQWWLSYL